MTSGVLRLFVLAAAVASLAACSAPATLGQIGLSPEQQAQVHMSAGKALALASAGLDGAVLIVEQRIKSGALRGQAEQDAGAELARAKTALDDAKAAYRASASYDPTSAITTISDAVAAARALAGA